MTAPLHPREADRLAVLQSLHQDEAAEAGLVALVRCAAQLTGAPMAMISLVGEHRAWACAAHGEVPDTLPHSQAFCAHAILQDGLFEIPDTLLDARFADHPLVSAGPRLRFYAGQPLRVDGLPMGTLCVLDQRPHRLSAADRVTLAELGAAATELLQSRRRLREAIGERERLLDFARAAGDWMWETNADHRLVWASDTYEAITGVPTATRIGHSIAELPLLDAHGQPEECGRRFHAVLDQHRPFARVLVGLDTMRGPLAISRSAVPVFDAQGRFAGYRGTGRDVSAVLAVEAEARRNAATLHRLAAQVPGALFTFVTEANGQQHYTFVGEGVRALCGLSVAQLLDDASLFWQLVHPDDLDALQHTIADHSARLIPCHTAYRLRRTDGELRWLETSAAPTRQADGSIVWHGFTTDITERHATEATLREHELRWQLAAEAANIGLAQLRLSDGSVQLDAQACKNHGWTDPQPGFTLTDWAAQLDPADRDTAMRGVQRTLAEGTPLEGRFRVHRPDGTVRWLEFIVRATYDADGRCTGAIGTCRDVHEQQIASALQRAKVEAENASRAKTEFLSRVSHELRTPLNAILGFAQLMALDEQQPLHGEQQRRLASIERGGRHLLDLINDVLDLTRIESADFALQLHPVDLGAALRRSVATVQPLAERRNIQLDTPSIHRHWVEGDTRAIEQVLMNLLSNAIRSAPPGQPVTIDIKHHASEVVLQVHDRGPGLSAEAVARLFEPFERLGTEQRRTEGSGLELLIARELAQAMHGRIEVDSRAETGSHVRLHLVACAAPPETDVLDAPLEAVAAEVAASTPTRRVIYVEDEPLNQVLVEEMFRARPHWKLEIAADGRSGLAMATRAAPDLMLIDMNLPDTNGTALLAQLRAKPALRGLRCIALSADAMREQIDAARAAGFDDYWTKPIDVPRMLRALDALLAPNPD